MDRIEILQSNLGKFQPAIWEEPFHEAWMANDNDDFVLRMAKAQAAEMIAAKPEIKPGELIVGDDRLHSIISGKQCPFGNVFRLDGERANQLKQLNPDSTDRIDEITGYWSQWFSDNHNRIPMTCHASLAYERFIELGVDGMRDYVASRREKNVIENPDCVNWYDALLIMIDGISGFITAHAVAAEAAAEAVENAERRNELLTIADNCRLIAHSKPETFMQAVQLGYFLFMLTGHDSPGPIDRYMWPTLKNQLDENTITLDQAQELVYCLWLKYEERTAYGATIGGVYEDGSDASNALSILFVKAHNRLRGLSPRTAMRWHRNMSPELLQVTVDCIADGCTLPAFVNDEAMIPAAVERGTKLEHARNYSFVGCGQTFPHGRGHGNYEDIIINSAKPLELALHNGIDPVTGKQMGPQTGDPATFDTWEKFEAAYREQIDDMLSVQIGWINERRRQISGQAFDLMRSLMTYSCIERGLDWHQGGADYSEGMVDMVGTATLTDSLVAIKIGVYEKQLVPLTELIKILDNNWEDHEDLRQNFLRQLPKYGNDDLVADSMAGGEVNRINEYIKSHKTHFGGPWGMDIIGWSGAVELGELTGATPDGRRAKDALADCCGPAQGRNIKGLTTTLNSTLLLPHLHSHGPLALSLRFPKEAVATPEQREKLKAVIETYFDQGGQQLQISVASTEDMKAALENPEAYRHLMVRVGGFSAYFVELDPRFQMDMIARSELEL